MWERRIVWWRLGCWEGSSEGEWNATTGLKPASRLGFYAALKRLSSTVLHAVLARFLRPL
jgi:hypothetical protein